MNRKELKDATREELIDYIDLLKKENEYLNVRFCRAAICIGDIKEAIRHEEYDQRKHIADYHKDFKETEDAEI